MRPNSWLGSWLVALLATIALVLPVLPRAARAQEVTCDAVSDFPCSLQLREVALQKVPTVFKLQARVSQAKLPVGEGLFNIVVVKLLRGTEVVCLERFANVQVRESVLNLEIGRNMSCELDEVIAENTDLAFQVCLGGAENCLRPIELAATPYSVKSSFASVSQTANEANVSGQSHYAHRATADRDLFVRKTLGTGYFDFYTHVAQDAASLYGTAEYEEFEDGGFLQWTPVRDRGALNLHIVGKDQATDQLRELSKLVLASDDTYATGNLTVQPPPTGTGLVVTAGGAHVLGDSDIDGTVLITGATTVQSGGLHVTGDSDVTGTLHVAGPGEITGTLLIGASTTVQSGGLHVTGDSEIGGALVISGATTVLSGGLAVTGNATLDGSLSTTGGADLGGATVIRSGGLQVGGTLDVSETVRVLDGGLHVTGDSDIVGVLLVTNGATVEQNGIQVTGNSAFDGEVAIGQTVLSDTGTKLVITGPVEFANTVTFSEGTSVIGDAYVLVTGETRDVSLGGMLTVTGATALGALAAGATTLSSLTVGAGTTVSGALTVGGASSLHNTTVTGTLGVTGAATLQNATASGTLTVTGTTTVGRLIAGQTTLGSVGVTTNATVGGTLGVTGATTLGSLSVSGNAGVAGTFTVFGETTLDTAIIASAGVRNDLLVLGSSTLANATVSGNLTVAGTVNAGWTVGMCSAADGSDPDLVRCACPSGLYPLSGGIQCEDFAASQEAPLYLLPYQSGSTWGWMGKCVGPSGANKKPQVVSVTCARLH